MEAQNSAANIVNLRIVAILSGGDWYDASVEHLVVPEGVNLNDAFSAWRKWYHDEYSAGMHFIDFCEWLKTKHNARDTTEAEIEVFME